MGAGDRPPPVTPRASHTVGEQVIKRSAHPDARLFDYLKGALDAEARDSVEEHLAGCAGCAAVAGLVRALKDDAGRSGGDESQTQNADPRILAGHPAVSELASFFYSKSPRSADRATAAHVARCRSCAEEIAEYARAERASSGHAPPAAAVGEVPAAAWGMIREWEESSFARPKAAGEAIGREMLEKLFNLLSEQKDWLRDARRSVMAQSPGEGETQRLVPVIVVDRSGQLRGVEVFERVKDADGESVLKHAEKSDRFDKKPLHALLDFGDKDRVVVTDHINQDTARLRQASRPDAKLRRADYFIIED
jgi:anti-sigma factor RsiW